MVTFFQRICHRIYLSKKTETSYFMWDTDYAQSTVKLIFIDIKPVFLFPLRCTRVAIIFVIRTYNVSSTCMESNTIHAQQYNYTMVLYSIFHFTENGIISSIYLFISVSSIFTYMRTCRNSYWLRSMNSHPGLFNFALHLFFTSILWYQSFMFT